MGEPRPELSRGEDDLAPGARLEVRPHAVVFGGCALARAPGGLAILIPYATRGDHLLVEVTRRYKRHAEARIVEILAHAATRTPAPCPYFGACGGCQYQHIRYEEELLLKTHQVRENFRRIGKLPDAPVADILPSPQPYGYRNRITVHAAQGKTGFRGADPRTLVDVESCAIAMPEVNAALRQLRARRPRPGHYSLRHPDVPPAGFHQVNHFMLETLREEVIAAVQDVAPEQRLANLRLLEGYAGGGFFTAPLARAGLQVAAIENDPRALRDAQRLQQALRADLHRPADFELLDADAADALPRLLGQADLDRTLVLVDPPRSGIPVPLLQALVRLPPAGLVYVSCDPSALARDAARLVQAFALEDVQPLDLFPRTAQIECIAAFRRRV